MNLELPDSPVLAEGESWPATAWALLGVTTHAVAPLPDESWLREHPLQELLEFLNQREETIRRMAEDPHRYGYEPFAWRILDAFCGFPWMEPAEAKILAEVDDARRAAMRTSADWCKKVRRLLLHQDDPIFILYLLGGNRAGKSEWAASRVVKILFARAGSKAWCFHQDQDMSRQYQQSLVYKYLPAELKADKGIRKNVTYISYKQQTGFSDEHFVLPRLDGAAAGSECDFRYYEQDIVKIQGGELDVVWCDELVPASWVKELKARVSTRNGWMFVTFTPVNGYTPTVKAALDVALTTHETTAFVLPRDGGAEDLELALVGEDLEAVVDGRLAAAQPAVPAGREFERVPRVKRMPDRAGAVFFFHSFDNPFGNPRQLYSLHAADGTDYKRMKFYGLPTKAVAQQFAFVAQVHTFRAEKLPKTGTRYQIIDPCSGRNWFMIWVLVDRAPSGKRYWIYREWPSERAYVPGAGVLGAWAEPGDKHDGVKGPAQNPLHWGIVRYLQEILRLEGHKDWESRGESAATETVGGAAEFAFDDDDRRATRAAPRRRRKVVPEGTEDIEERFMDARYGATPTQTREGDTTLIEACGEAGLHLVQASGAQTTEKGTGWRELINDLLAYDTKRPIDPLNTPRLFVSEECTNVIFALQNWTGEDGLKGACMDPIATIKYLVLGDLEDYSDERKGRAA